MTDKDIVAEARELAAVHTDFHTGGRTCRTCSALHVLANEVERLRKQAAGIKPLEWERINRSNPFWIARPLPDVQYQVGWVGGDLPTRWLKVGVREADGRCASPEEGKQLAEQHWQEYIKQALVEVVDGCQP